MFKDFEKLTKKGTVIFGNSNSSSEKFFCFWQGKNSFDFTRGLLTDLELSDYNYIASALEDCKCIPFGRGNTPLEAYEKMSAIFDKYFDEDGNWISYYYEYRDFLKVASDINGYVDFMSKKEDDFALFKEIKNYEKSYMKYVSIVLQKYNELKDIKKIKEYFDDELDWFISINMIEKILKYNSLEKMQSKELEEIIKEREKENKMSDKINIQINSLYLGK